MRNYVLLYVNGRRHEVSGGAAFSSLASLLRHEQQLTGTKIVCAEGDCGACTVLLGRFDGHSLRYETVDSCIQFVHQADCTHVISVEGLAANGQLSAVQQVLVDRHGSQCGYCTPGFVTALAGLCEAGCPAEADAVRLGLTGNLCRCTGYVPILQAGLSVLRSRPMPLAEQYSSAAMHEELRRQSSEPLLIHTRPDDPACRVFFSPRTLADALEFKSRHPEAVIVSGATELGVLSNKKGYDPAVQLSLHGIHELNALEQDNGCMIVGANVPWTQMERFARDRLPEFYKIIIRFGSPQIRNVATLVGNVAHGSPIADSLPFFLIMEADVELASVRGARRVPITRFYTGYKTKELAPEEIITRVHVPLPAADELVKLYKVSKRNDLDIATFGAGIRLKRAGEIITRAYIAYAGVAPTVLRLPRTEAFLQGKLFNEGTFCEAGHFARSEITPISDVRGSRDFRWQLAENIMQKFYFDCAQVESSNA